jgi:hypothetical protein
MIIQKAVVYVGGAGADDERFMNGVAWTLICKEGKEKAEKQYNCFLHDATIP